MTHARRAAMLLFLSVFTLLFAAECPDEHPPMKVMYQTELAPASVNFSPYCVDNDAWSVGSAVIGCDNDLFTPGNEVLEFLSASEADVRTLVEDFWASRQFLDEPGMVLLLNCEEPIHVKDWWVYNDFPALQQTLFQTMKMRVDLFREYFPSATITLGPSIRGHSAGNYLQLILDREESLVRAGEYGVFDSCDCFEPRVFLSYGPDDGPQWMSWTLGMTAQALDISSDLRNSYGLPLPLCVTSSFEVFNNSSEHDGEVVPETAALQLPFILMYPNVKSISWWAGGFDALEQLTFLEEVNPCTYTD